MAVASGEHDRGMGAFILRQRASIGIVLIAITLFMGFWAAHVPIATRFEDLFPARHPNTLLYRQFRRQYGGAQQLVLMLRVRHGDIFNFRTLHAIQDMTREVDKLPGVNHNEVFSLASYRVLYARAEPGALVSAPYMYPDVPHTQQQLDELKSIVRAHQQQLAGLVTRDERGAVVIASFNELGLDYKALFDGVQRIIREHEDRNTRIYASGAAMFAAWGYHYLARIGMIFVVSAALMVLIAFLALGRRTGWWAPVLTGVCSAIWGLGFVGLMRFNFDPVMLVVPFILTARDLSHGIQWHGRYYEELDRCGDNMRACAATADAMMAPGLLAVLANVAGVIFVAASDVPILRQIGLGGAVWLGASLAMVFVFQPILMSYLPRPELRESSWLSRLGGDRAAGRRLVDRLAAFPTAPGLARGTLIAAGAGLMIVGLAAARRVRVGYQTAGTPIYRPEAKVNRDTAEIGKLLPVNSGWVVIDTPGYPSSQSSVGIETLRMSDDLASYLMARGDAVAVLGFGTLASKPMNMLLHNGYPKYFALPATNQLSANLWGFFFAAAAPDEPQAYFAYSPAMNNTCIRLLLPDHTNARLTRLRSDLDAFVRERVAADPALNQIKVRYLGGEAGLYLATDDVMARLNWVNLALVLAAILACCAMIFRSPAVGLFFAVACVMANFGAFLYMNALTIGLTVDTIPVISLGIGLGIDYAIYAVARIRDEVIEGCALNDAIAAALRTTGIWVFATYAVMVGGMLPWVFSPLLFHNEMSSLLILLMTANLIVGLFILPAFIAWRRPRFITRYGSAAPAAPATAPGVIAGVRAR
jgi:predicted RND superfamily exporter protein